MAANAQAKFAEIQENHRLIFILLIFLMGLGAGIRALAYYFPRGDYSLINWLHNGVGITQVIVLVILLFSLGRMLYLCSAEGRRKVLLDSFVERTNLVALSISWVLTFFMAMAVSEWTEPDVLLYGAHDPASLLEPRYYLQLLICCMALSYSLSFFFLYRADNDGDAA